ncbi:hypothetical protein D3C81_1373820 [compost metagenome]|nr:DUF2790 domain-containing protein [Pseudomonas putida]
MTLRTVFALTLATLALGTSAGTYAQSTEATPYHYGMNLDIAEVISLAPSATSQGQASTATMTYRDSTGQVRSIRYYQPDDAQGNQN